MAFIKNINDMREAAEAIAQFHPKTVELSGGFSVSVKEVEWSGFTDLFGRLKESLLSIVALKQSGAEADQLLAAVTDKMLEIPDVVYALAVNSTCPHDLYSDEAAEWASGIMRLGWKAVVKIATAAIEVNFLDTAVVADFFAVGGLLLNKLKVQEAAVAQTPKTMTPAELLALKQERKAQATASRSTKSASALSVAEAQEA